MKRPPLAGLATALTLTMVPVGLAVLPSSAGAAGAGAAAAKQSPAGSVTEGSFTLEGEEAAAYRVPSDVEEVWRSRFPDGTTQTRYQQVVEGAEVLGGQVTVLRDATGITAVIGAHFAGLRPTNSLKLAPADSLQVAARLLGAQGNRATTLHIDPRSGSLYYEVETQRFASRWILWVDAQTGAVLNRFDAIAEGDGTGVKGDRKTIDTTPTGDRFQLQSADGRQKTYDAGNTTTSRGTMMTDDDDTWNTAVPLNPSPSQPPGVDAHYYANLVDDFFGDTYSRDSMDDAGMPIISTVHYDAGYCNAFWNGSQMTYGDGDGVNCYALSGGLDVVGHELTHGVTEFTSGLIYENESGALNESFSDMMGNTAEFYAADRDLDPAAEPDWLIGEDVIPAGVYGGAEAGFRNMGNPRADGDPDHYSERYTGTADNGGVHTNSGIPNHAYYLAVVGGRNAGCADGSSDGHTHVTDCATTVTPVGLARAEQIFYQAFTSLTEYANFCDARNATVAVAKSARRSISDAWAAVGVQKGCEPAIPPPPPCVGDDTAQVPFESPHPYGNNGDCTWTYDNGSAGFAFHFSLLETEAGYDYIYVKDANGNVLATYDGTHPLPGGVTTPCIPTSVGSIQLVTDQSVTDQGFTVDAVEPC